MEVRSTWKTGTFTFGRGGEERGWRDGGQEESEASMFWPAKQGAGMVVGVRAILWDHQARWKLGYKPWKEQRGRRRDTARKHINEYISAEVGYDNEVAQRTVLPAHSFTRIKKTVRRTGRNKKSDKTHQNPTIRKKNRKNALFMEMPYLFQKRKCNRKERRRGK